MALPDEAKRLLRVRRIVFSVGIALLVVGWAYWMVRVGPSWWFAYRDSGPNELSTGAAAERVRTILLINGALLCMVAPLVSQAPVRRRLLYSLFALGSALIVFYILGFIVFFGFYGF